MRMATVRITSGLILFVFVLMHFINHMFGIIGIDAMVKARLYTTHIWTQSLGLTLLLLLAFLAHVVTSLITFFKRRTMHLFVWQWVQLILGLILPFLVIRHVLFLGFLNHVYGMDLSYPFVLGALWIRAPIEHYLMFGALVFVWTHGVIGIHFWLRFKPFYSRVFTSLKVLAFGVPLLALAGYVSAGYEIRRAVEQNPAIISQILKKITIPKASLDSYVSGIPVAMKLLLILYCICGVLYFLWYKNLFMRSHPRVSLWGGGKSYALPKKANVLDVLLSNRVPIAHMCGGKGRCSTCRIQVTKGDYTQNFNSYERKTLDRIKAPQGVRLACQFYPQGDVTVRPLIPVKTGGAGAVRKDGGLTGEERTVAVLFLDIRDSTALAEEILPFDTLFILNTFFVTMSRVLKKTGGHYANFTGDGFMALYGVSSSPQTACRKALEGARQMFEQLDAINKRLEKELPHPLEIGVGIHVGKAIVGLMGPPEAQIVSALGDTVNTAARLESLCKEFSAKLVVSKAFVKQAGIDIEKWQPLCRKVTLKGHSKATTIYGFSSLLPFEHKEKGKG